MGAWPMQHLSKRDARAIASSMNARRTGFNYLARPMARPIHRRAAWEVARYDNNGNWQHTH